MDYYTIGQNIRKIRKAQGLSQEELAEKIKISTTHMSHIETGNTKLSLPVLVDIATVLGVKTVDLLKTEKVDMTTGVIQDVAQLLDGCSVQEAKVIADVVKATKLAMDKYL